MEIDAVQRVWIGAELGRDLQDHVILVQRGEQLGRRAFAKGVVECRIDVLGRDAELGGGIAIDMDPQLWPAGACVAIDGRETGDPTEGVGRTGGPQLQFGRVAVHQRELVLALGNARADRDVL